MCPPVYHVALRNVCFTSDLADKADRANNQLNIHSQREYTELLRPEAKHSGEVDKTKRGCLTSPYQK